MAVRRHSLSVTQSAAATGEISAGRSQREIRAEGATLGAIRHRFWFGLLLFLIFGWVAFSIVPTLLLGAYHRSALHFTLAFFAGVSYWDSWEPMRMAFDALAAGLDASLYQTLFFDRLEKFQYPLTSLLIFELLTPFGLSSDEALNTISRALVLVTVAGMMLLADALIRRLKLHDIGSAGLDRLALAGLVGLATITFYPLMRGVWFGQIQTWITAFFVLACLCWVTDRRIAAGVLVGLICLIKPQLGLMVPWALVRRQWGFLAGWAAAFVPLALVALALYGLDNNLDYLRVLSHIAQHGEVWWDNQTVNGVVNRLLFNGNIMKWDPHSFAPYDVRVHVVTFASSAALIAAALFWRFRAADRAGWADFAIAAITFTVASPIAWQHHFGTLLPLYAIALGLILDRERRTGRGRVPWRLAWLGLSYLLVSNFLPMLNAAAYTPFNIVQSYRFFGVVILLGCFYSLRAGARRAAAGAGIARAPRPAANADATAPGRP